MMTTEELKKLIADVVADRSEGSLSRRNPGLGKMVNCLACGDRHRSSRACILNYARLAPVTQRGLTPLAERKKRYHPHPNKAGLQLLEATVRNFEDYGPFMADQKAAMHISRARSAREIRARVKDQANEKRQRQDLSRRINRGLVQGNKNGKN
jgi:hypothetical protein